MIEYGAEQGLAALIYGEKWVSSLPIQDITGETKGKRGCHII